ncbi:MAG: enoyl-CoA hydratase/isomerase family protein [Chitinophagales bacterium]
MGDAVLFEVNEQGVAIITMNHPQNFNAFNHDLCQGLIDAATQANEREDVKVVVLTGTGLAFSAGGDINLLAEMDSPARAKWTFDGSTETVRRILDIGKPVIAAVNGAVAGAALSMMMACDMIIAAEEARFLFSFIHIAFCPDSGCSYFLTRKVGYHKAAEILLLGKVLNTEEASQLGLINKVVPAGNSLEESLKWAGKMARGPLYTSSMIKKLLRQADASDFNEQAEAEALYQVLAWSSPDFQEGARAFLEKRKPVFTGRS